MVVKLSPSFGMAYMVKTKTFMKLGKEEFARTQKVFENAGDKLNKITKDADVNFVYSPKESKINIIAVPQKASLKQVWNATLEVLKMPEDYEYAQSIKYKDFNEETLIAKTIKAVKEAFRRFGDPENAEKVAKDL